MVAVDALGLEAARALRGPGVDFLADAIGASSPRCASRAARCRSTGPELRMRGPICSPRSIRRRARHHAFGIDFAAGERRRDAVGEKEDRVDRVLVDALLAEQVDRVVRVQVEEARQHRFAGGELHDAGAASSRPVSSAPTSSSTPLRTMMPVFGTSVSRTPSKSCPPVRTMSPA